MSKTIVVQKVGYKRVSTREQSTDRQLADLELDIVFEDKISGSVKERPGLDACILHLRAHDVLYIHSIDRLARSLVQALQLIETIISKGVTIIFVKESLTFSSKADHTSKLMLHIMSAVAEFERSMIRERQREGIEQVKQSGKTKTGRPIGKPPLDKNLLPKILDLKKQGLSIYAISRELKICRASVYKLLNHA